MLPMDEAGCGIVEEEVDERVVVERVVDERVIVESVVGVEDEGATRAVTVWTLETVMMEIEMEAVGMVVDCAFASPTHTPIMTAAFEGNNMLTWVSVNRSYKRISKMSSRGRQESKTSTKVPRST